MTARPNTAVELAKLSERLEQFMKSADRDRKVREQHDKEADASRKELRQGVADLQRGHEVILRRVDKIEPVADMVTSLKAKVVGGLAVLGIIGGIIISAVTYFKQQLLSLIGW